MSRVIFTKEGEGERRSSRGSGGKEIRAPPRARIISRRGARIDRYPIWIITRDNCSTMKGRETNREVVGRLLDDYFMNPANHAIALWRPPAPIWVVGLQRAPSSVSRWRSSTQPVKGETFLEFQGDLTEATPAIFHSSRYRIWARADVDFVRLYFSPISRDLNDIMLIEFDVTTDDWWLTTDTIKGLRDCIWSIWKLLYF